MKVVLVAIPAIFVIILVIGFVGGGGLGPVELGLLAAMVVLWVSALLVLLWPRWGRRPR